MERTAERGTGLVSAERAERSKPSVLDEILLTKLDEVTLLHQPATREAIRTAALAAGPTRDFAAGLRRADGRLAVIAEIKRPSPSKGDLAPDLDPALTAKAYESGGAAALSVLTDGPFFGGTVADLQIASESASLPILRKDFVIDESQVWEARAIGADAVLLIVAAIPDDQLLRELQVLATELDLAALVEAHDGNEVERALAAGARIVGVNCRNLGSFAEDLTTAERLRSDIPAEVIAVAESAIRSPEDARRMAGAGYDAILVGEYLVRSADPVSTLRSLIEEERNR
ncbi:MAG: indole-3-glycerol phosphate synthase TrpC [Acidimicrobiia bacterium]